MKLTNLRKVGRFRNKSTNKEVNIHKGKKPGYSTDTYFYLYMGKRIYISCQELSAEWERR